MNIQRPSAGLIAALAVAGLTSAAFTPTGPNEGWASSSMRHRASEKFDYVLGQEKWQPLGDEISLFGQEFPVEMIGPVHFEIDSNGDGRVDRDIKGSDGFVDLKENAEGQVFHYGVRFRNEGEREWSWTASGAMAGKVEGLTMAVIDANANGRYDDLGVDGLVIGKDRGAGYVSRIVNIDGKLFEFDINADGTEVRTRPYTGETGVLTLKKIKGIKASVVTAIARQGKDVSFQIAGAKKGVVVPVGDYVLADAFLEGGSETARIRMGRMEEARGGHGRRGGHPARGSPRRRGPHAPPAGRQGGGQPQRPGLRLARRGVLRFPAQGQGPYLRAVRRQHGQAAEEGQVPCRLMRLGPSGHRGCTEPNRP